MYTRSDPACRRVFLACEWLSQLGVHFVARWGSPSEDCANKQACSPDDNLHPMHKQLLLSMLCTAADPVTAVLAAACEVSQKRNMSFRQLAPPILVLASPQSRARL